MYSVAPIVRLDTLLVLSRLILEARPIAAQGPHVCV